MNYPRENQFIKKTYFVADTPNGPCREFTKHSYKPIPSNGYVLIHYLGNETAHATCGFTHGNSKHHLDRQYTHTCPSVLQSIKNECTLSTAAKVYRKNITNQPPTSHLPVLHETLSKLKTYETRSKGSRELHYVILCTIIRLHLTCQSLSTRSNPTLICYVYVDTMQ